MSAAEVLALLGPAAPGSVQVVCVDGRAGTGKSTLAAEVAAACPGTRVVHTDDLVPGWDGLPQVPALLAALLEPLVAGRAGTYPRYDWVAGQVAGTVVVDPQPGLIVVEGVGAGARSLRHLRSLLVWLDAPTEVRRERALTRDGDTFAPYWDGWADAEETYLALEADRAAADLVLHT